MKWQPIETAPKDDESYILVYCPPKQAVFEWIDGCGNELVEEPYPEFVGSALWDECDRKFVIYAHFLAQIAEPTHWMPMPQPPAH